MGTTVVKCFESDGSFIFTIKTDNPGTSASNQFTIPTAGTGYNYSVDWGDGSKELIAVDTSQTHTYPAPGTYTIRIRGVFPRIYFNNERDILKLLEVSQWGNVGWTSMNRAFWGCGYARFPARDGWNFRNVTNMELMMRQCYAFNESVESWDTSNVTSMSQLFAISTSFNQPLDGFDTSKVTSMFRMFYNAQSFNQPLTTFDTSNVIDMTWMLRNTNFNQDISNFNVSKVIFMPDFLVSNFVFSTINYDKALISWSTQPLQSNVIANFGTVKYSAGAAATARQYIIDTFNWTITDGGQA